MFDITTITDLKTIIDIPEIYAQCNQTKEINLLLTTFNSDVKHDNIIKNIDNEVANTELFAVSSIGDNKSYYKML